MNLAEEIFVKTFVVRPCRERALHELGSGKRGGFLNRLCHDGSGVFKARYIQPISDLASDRERLRVRLIKSGAGDSCHVISCNDAVDGKELSLKDAIDATFGFGLPSIVICIPDSLAYFEAEQEKGPPRRYLLVNPGGKPLV